MDLKTLYRQNFLVLAQTLHQRREVLGAMISAVAEDSIIRLSEYSIHLLEKNTNSLGHPLSRSCDRQQNRQVCPARTGNATGCSQDKTKNRLKRGLQLGALRGKTERPDKNNAWIQQIQMFRVWKHRASCKETKSKRPCGTMR